MRYSSEILIELPRKQVIDLFDDADNLFEWMKGLQSVELISGEAGQVGAQSKMSFEMGKRHIAMVETILERKFPDYFKTAYETKGVYNEVENFFIEEGEITRYRTVHYFRFDSWAMRLMAKLMPKAFKKQSMQYLKDFKAFAESNQEHD